MGNDFRFYVDVRSIWNETTDELQRLIEQLLAREGWIVDVRPVPNGGEPR